MIRVTEELPNTFRLSEQLVYALLCLGAVSLAAITKLRFFCDTLLCNWLKLKSERELINQSVSKWDSTV